MAFSAFSSFKNNLTTQLSSQISRLSQRAPQITLIADRVYTMPLPITQEGQTTNALAESLKGNHGEHFMVWNLSEKAYNYDLFDNQVLEFKFPGHPCPPLNVLIQLIKSIRSWLEADPTNIAIVHCATGHIRTATVVACYLAFCRICPDVQSALAHYYHTLKIDHASVTIPSQLRYIDYFSQVQEGFDPKERMLHLQCIVANEMPATSEMPPIIQIFQHGAVIFSSANHAPEHFATGSISFPVGCDICGDVLIRCRQPGPINPQGRRTMHSLFRLNLHTAFVGEELLRLTCAQLDGPHKEQHWPTTMFVDLIFSQQTLPEGASTAASPSSQVWKVAREQQKASQQQAQRAVSELADAKEEVAEYETYKPYVSRSRRGSLDMDDEIAAEIAGTKLPSEDPSNSQQQAQHDADDEAWERQLEEEMEQTAAESAEQHAGVEEAQIAELQVTEALRDQQHAQVEEEIAGAEIAQDQTAVAEQCTEAEITQADLSEEQAAVADIGGQLQAELAATIEGTGEKDEFEDEFGEDDFDGDFGGDLDDDAWMLELEAELERGDI